MVERRVNKRVNQKDRVKAATPDRTVARVAGLAALVSLFFFFYYFQHSDILLYGDAVAHINIARRVIDSQTPGLLQLGTVWLPLPHLLMIPFILWKQMWQNGGGASIPSMIAYVFGVVGVFRLVRGILEAANKQGPKSAAGVAAAAAAFAYGANPNLIYMQATAMTESLYLSLFIWSVVYFTEFVRSVQTSHSPKSVEADPHPASASRSALIRCAWCLAGAELTRYDGWFLAGAVGVVIVAIALWRWRDPDYRALRPRFVKFVLSIAVVPILWLGYNRVVYGNALEFANGPYSAKAIEQRVGAPNPAFHSAGVAAIYFLKSAQLNMAEGNWGRFWLAAAILASIIGAWKLRTQATALFLLWIPLPFYALSIAYGSVPVHVYTWWPFATFNQRYGLQLLPMFVVSTGVLGASVSSLTFREGAPGRHAGKLVALIFALMIGSYATVWKQPQCLQEARRNWQTRNPLDSAVERVVSGLPRHSRFLMNLGEHVAIMEQLGIPLRQVVNNENHRPWKRPSDPEGLWERALADPARYVDFVIAFDGDLVDQALNRTNLIELTEIHAGGQPHAHLYATRRDPNQQR
jgi:hypothetical protein